MQLRRCDRASAINVARCTQCGEDGVRHAGRTSSGAHSRLRGSMNACVKRNERTSTNMHPQTICTHCTASFAQAKRLLRGSSRRKKTSKGECVHQPYRRTCQEPGLRQNVIPTQDPGVAVGRSAAPGNGHPLPEAKETDICRPTNQQLPLLRKPRYARPRTETLLK